MSEAVYRLLESGYELQTAGRLEEAEARYRDVLKREPRNIHALNLLGVICINTARPRDAIDYIATAIGENANDAEAYANLGLAQKDLQQFDSAADSFRSAIRLNPANPVMHNNLGNVLAATEQHKEAVASYRQALRIAPDYAECLSNLSAALKETAQIEKALAAVDRAIALEPGFAEAHNNRGEILFKQSKFADAVSSYRNAVKLDNRYVDAMINLSAALKEVGDLAESQQVLEAAIQVQPDNARAYNNLGVMFEQLGDGAAAADAFRKALELAPDYANAYYQLAQLRGYGLDNDEVEKVQQLLQAADTPPQHRKPLNFALACAYEARDDYERSFACLAEAQALKALENPYNDDEAQQHYQRIVAVYDRDAATPGEPEAVDGPATVFVLGMPRSGTTLTEQILASHPDVFGAGELSFMEDVIGEARSFSGREFPHCQHELTAEQRRQLGQSYLERVTALGNGESVIVDKTPMNFQYIGFILSILPRARIIHCRRNPIDNCLSIFRLPFEQSHSYAHSLESLGQYYCRYRQLMAFWQSKYGERILNVDYEETVANQEQQSRRIVEFCGLPFDDQVLEFHRSKRIVKTPSASQVRQPIYQTAVLRWKKYEKHLGPLISQLGELAHD